MAISLCRNTALQSTLALFMCLQFFPMHASAIAAPSNLHGTETAQSTVNWEWDSVVDATQYEVTLDGVHNDQTAASSYTSQNLWAGEHSLHVRAISADSRYSFASETAKIRVRAVHDANIANRVGTIPEQPQAEQAQTQEQQPQAQAQEQQAQAQVQQPQAAESASVEPATQQSAVVDQSAVDQGVIDPASLSMPEVQQKAGFELIFSDEFNGASLNPTRWNTQLRWDGEFNGERYEYRVINGEDQLYVNIYSDDQNHMDTVVPKYNPFQFNGSRLAIRAERNPLKTNANNKDHGSLADIASQQTFLSGALSTYDKFSHKYGYFEARMKIPHHDGTFPAFWLHHQKRSNEGTQKTEIDIMENLGHAPQYVYNSFHYFTNVSQTRSGEGNFLKPLPQGQIYTGTDYSQDYHVYAVDWEPSKITWFIDGQKVSELSNGAVNHEELYLIINMAMGGNWTNFPTSAGGLGRSPDQHYPNGNDLESFNNPALEIDYVRVYKRR